jgi:hypothetical protein
MTLVGWVGPTSVCSLVGWWKLKLLEKSRQMPTLLFLAFKSPTQDRHDGFRNNKQTFPE